MNNLAGKKVRFDHIIQVIGPPDSGKSTIARIIQVALEKEGVQVWNDDLSTAGEDDKDVHGKDVLINTFRAQHDRQLKEGE